MNKKIIVWGFPMVYPLKNTISYVWNSFYRAFKYLECEVYWFDNNNFPKDFDFSNCIFLAEGYDDSNIPLNNSSIYFVHCAYNPQKYIGNVKKFIDVRYNLLEINHPNYIYKLDKEKTTLLDKGCYYEPSTNQVIHFKNGKVEYDIQDFDKIYLSWATNLMPNEINEEDVYRKRGDSVLFLGTLTQDGEYANVDLINRFADECRKNGIKFKINNFYDNQLTEEDYIELSKKSLLGFDIRCSAHVKWGHIPCRLFKNISYGHLGMTNALEAYKELDGHCIYSPSPEGMFYDVMAKKDDYSFIKDGLNYVKSNHTYVNRVKSMLKII